jgi:hypothetical protein
MANLLRKKVRTSDLTEETHSLLNPVKQYLLSDVKYDRELLAYATTQYDNPSLAILLSGSTDKKSKEYKAAIRAVQVWKKTGRNPSAKYQKKIINALADTDNLPSVYTQDAINRKGASTVTIHIRGYVQISNSPPEYRTMKATLSDGELQAFLNDSLESNQQDALDIFANAGNYPQFSMYSSDNIQTSVQFL